MRNLMDRLVTKLIDRKSLTERYMLLERISGWASKVIAHNTGNTDENFNVWKQSDADHRGRLV
jgi:hypothetical protein